MLDHVLIKCFLGVLDALSWHWSFFVAQNDVNVGFDDGYLGGRLNEKI